MHWNNHLVGDLQELEAAGLRWLLAGVDTSAAQHDLLAREERYKYTKRGRAARGR